MMRMWRGSFTRGTSVLAALVLAAILSTIGFGIHELVPHARSQSAAVLLADAETETTQTTTGAPTTASSASPELTARVEVSDQDARCKAAVSTSESEGDSAEGTIANKCVKGCEYRIRQSGLTTVAAATDLCRVQSAQLGQCPDAPLSARTSCQATRVAAYQQCSFNSPCVVKICDKDGSNCKEIDPNSISKYLTGAGILTPTSVLPSDPEVQRAIQNIANGDSEVNRIYAELSREQQDAMKPAITEQIATNNKTIEQLIQRGETAAADEIAVQNERLERASKLVVNPELSNDQATLQPGAVPGEGNANPGTAATPQNMYTSGQPTFSNGPQSEEQEKFNEVNTQELQGERDSVPSANWKPNSATADAGADSPAEITYPDPLPSAKWSMICGEEGANPDSCIPRGTRETGGSELASGGERNPYPESGTPGADERASITPKDNDQREQLERSGYTCDADTNGVTCWKDTPSAAGSGGASGNTSGVMPCNPNIENCNTQATGRQPETSVRGDANAPSETPSALVTKSCPDGVCVPANETEKKSLEQLGYHCLEDSNGRASCSKPTTLNCPKGICTTSDGDAIKELRAKGYTCMGDLDGVASCTPPRQAIKDGTVPDKIEEPAAVGGSNCVVTHATESDRLWLMNRGYQCSAAMSGGGYYCSKANTTGADDASPLGCAPLNPTIAPPAPPTSVKLSTPPPQSVTIQAAPPSASPRATDQQVNDALNQNPPEPPPAPPTSSDIQNQIAKQNGGWTEFDDANAAPQGCPAGTVVDASGNCVAAGSAAEESKFNDANAAPQGETNSLPCDSQKGSCPLPQKTPTAAADNETHDEDGYYTEAPTYLKSSNNVPSSEEMAQALAECNKDKWFTERRCFAKGNSICQYNDTWYRNSSEMTCSPVVSSRDPNFDADAIARVSPAPVQINKKMCADGICTIYPGGNKERETLEAQGYLCDTGAGGTFCSIKDPDFTGKPSIPSSVGKTPDAVTNPPVIGEDETKSTTPIRRDREGYPCSDPLAIKADCTGNFPTQPPSGTTKTCPDGSVIRADGTCPPRSTKQPAPSPVPLPTPTPAPQPGPQPAPQTRVPTPTTGGSGIYGNGQWDQSILAGLMGLSSGFSQSINGNRCGVASPSMNPALMMMLMQQGNGLQQNTNISPMLLAMLMQSGNQVANGVQCANQQQQYPYPYPQQTTPQAQCPAAPAQPDAAQCANGSWTPQETRLSNGQSCVTGWTCAQTPAPSADISCSPAVAEAGMSIAISYSCANAKTSSALNFSSNGELSGSASVTAVQPSSGTSVVYGIACINGARVATSTCSVQVAKPSIVMVANPQQVKSGGHATIGWVTSGMQSCTISSPDSTTFTSQNATKTAVSGSAQTPALTSDMRAVLSCTTVSGKAKAATTTVQVSP